MFVLRDGWQFERLPDNGTRIRVVDARGQVLASIDLSLEEWLEVLGRLMDERILNRKAHSAS